MCERERERERETLFGNIVHKATVDKRDSRQAHHAVAQRQNYARVQGERGKGGFIGLPPGEGPKVLRGLRDTMFYLR